MIATLDLFRHAEGNATIIQATEWKNYRLETPGSPKGYVAIWHQLPGGRIPLRDAFHPWISSVPVIWPDFH